jgi:hypothetical protein
VDYGLFVCFRGMAVARHDVAMLVCAPNRSCSGLESEAKMARTAQFAVALVLVTGVPAANAGLVKDTEILARKAHEAEEAKKAAEAAKAGVEINVEGGSVDGTGVKTDIGAPGQINVTGLSTEVNGAKVEPKLGGNTGSGGESSGKDDTPWWFYVLFFLGVGGWILSKFSSKRS